MQDSREKKQCLIFVRNNANDTADRIEAYAKSPAWKLLRQFSIQIKKRLND